MTIHLTSVFENVDEGYVAYVAEVPGAMTFGKTLDQARTQLWEALLDTLETNRKITNESIAGGMIRRESIRFEVVSQ